MTMRALVLLCFLALPAAAQDWRDLRWGMDRAEIEAVMGDSLELLDVPREYGGGLSAPFFLEGAEIGGLPFRAWLQLGVDGGLRQILFERRRGEARPLDFSTLDEGLAAELGPPDRRCEVPLRPGRPAVREAVWYRERGTTHALFFDFGTTERVTRVEGDPFVRVPVPQVTPSPVPAPRAVRPPPPLPPVEGPLPPGEKRLGDPPARHPIPEPRFSPPLPPPPATGLDGAVRFDAERRAPARRLLVRLHDPAASDLAATRCPD